MAAAKATAQMHFRAGFSLVSCSQQIAFCAAIVALRSWLQLRVDVISSHPTRKASAATQCILQPQP